MQCWSLLSLRCRQQPSGVKNGSDFTFIPERFRPIEASSLVKGGTHLDFLLRGKNPLPGSVIDRQFKITFLGYHEVRDSESARRSRMEMWTLIEVTTRPRDNDLQVCLAWAVKSWIANRFCAGHKIQGVRAVWHANDGSDFQDLSLDNCSRVPCGPARGVAMESLSMFTVLMGMAVVAQCLLSV